MAKAMDIIRTVYYIHIAALYVSSMGITRCSKTTVFYIYIQ